jgi:hypothetical protein
VELGPGTLLFWDPENFRTAVEDRHIGGLSLVIVLGEAFAHLEFASENDMPMILTTTAVSPIVQDFGRVPNLLSQVLLAMITREAGTG